MRGRGRRAWSANCAHAQISTITTMATIMMASDPEAFRLLIEKSQHAQAVQCTVYCTCRCVSCSVVRSFLKKVPKFPMLFFVVSLKEAAWCHSVCFFCVRNNRMIRILGSSEWRRCAWQSCQASQAVERRHGVKG